MEARRIAADPIGAAISAQVGDGYLRALGLAGIKAWHFTCSVIEQNGLDLAPLRRGKKVALPL